MPISTATIIAQADEVFGFDNLAPLAGTFRNIFWDQAGSTALVWGIQRGKFTFDFERVNLKFTNLAPTIPEDAIIISAVLRGTAQATSTSADFFTVIRTLTRDGCWDPVTTDGWKSASSVGGPFGTLRTAAHVIVRNVVFTALVDTGISPDRTWPIRDNINLRGRRGGQGVDIVTGGTLGFVEIDIDKTGSGGAGNIWAEIYSQGADGLADTLLATSVVRPASDAPATPALLTFAFTGPEQIALSAAQKVVVVLNGDYPVSAVNNVGMRWTNGGYSIGTFQLDGIGRGFNEQNAPMQMSFRNVPGDGFIIWIAPQFVVGVDYDTPDFSAMLQNHLAVSGYSEGDPFAFSVERNLFLFPNVTADRRWASSTHGTFPSVRLIVEWEQVDAPKKSDAVVSSDIFGGGLSSDIFGGAAMSDRVSAALVDTSLGAGVVLDSFGAIVRSPVPVPVAAELDAIVESVELESGVIVDELSARIVSDDVANLLADGIDATIAIDSPIGGRIDC